MERNAINVRTCAGLVLAFQAAVMAEANLSPTVREWVDITLSNFSQGWGEAAGMIGDSRGHETRGAMFYALGLLQRGREEDRERACKAIRSVCRQQYIAPGTPYHGKSSVGDKDRPPADGGDYDRNWREFVGLGMVLVLEQCGDSVDDAARNAMLGALRHACEGARNRRACSLLYDTCMVGVQVNPRIRNASTQYHPLTVHWKGEGGAICWIRLKGDTPAIISPPDGGINIVPARKSQSMLTFEVYAPGAEAASFKAESWRLPGMLVKTPVVPISPKVTQNDGLFTVSYDFPKGTSGRRMVLDINGQLCVKGNKAKQKR